MKGFGTRVLEEAGCSPDYRDQKSQSNCADISDVPMVRKLRAVTLGGGERA